MARSRKKSEFEVFVEIVAKLPWKICLLLAVVSYLVLHTLAGIKVEQPAHVGVLMFASIGQLLFPAGFLFGAVVSFLKQRKNKQLYESIANHSPAETKSSALQAVERLTWQKFEMLVGESFRRKGYSVEETGGGGADGGIDLAMSLNGQRYLVQCKQWKTFKVGVKVVREFFGVMVANGAKGGFVVTSGVFTQEGASFAEDKNITLIDGEKLLKIINAAHAGKSTEQRVSAAGQVLSNAFLKEEKGSSPVCPRCNNAMVKRTAKQGVNAGKEFWGCSQYPKCKSVVAIPT